MDYGMNKSPTERWEELRRNARRLESDVETKLGLLAKLSAKTTDRSSEVRVTIHSDPHDKEPLLGTSESATNNTVQQLCPEIESLINRLSDINTLMVACCDELNNSSMNLSYQRHRDLLSDYSREFASRRAVLNAKQEREQLLSSTVITNASSNGWDATADRKLETLSREHGHIKNSEMMIDEQLHTASRARESLLTQRTALKAIQTQMTHLANRFPLINSLVQRIGLRRKRDSIILAAVTSLCIFLTIIYIF